MPCSPGYKPPSARRNNPTSQKASSNFHWGTVRVQQNQLYHLWCSNFFARLSLEPGKRSFENEFKKSTSSANIQLTSYRYSNPAMHLSAQFSLNTKPIKYIVNRPWAKWLGQRANLQMTASAWISEAPASARVELFPLEQDSGNTRPHHRIGFVLASSHISGPLKDELTNWSIWD